MNFSEKKIILNNGVVGILNNDLNIKNTPIVLMLHGFGSQKNEVGNLFEDLSNKIAKNGMASLRIDFYGFGESTGKTCETSMETYLKDTKLALDYIYSLENIDKENIYLLGFSLGAGIALIFSSKNKDKIKSLLLWSSVTNLRENFLASLENEAFEKAQKNDIVELDLGWRKISLSSNFFNTLHNYDLNSSLKEYNKKVLFIYGSKDDLFRNNNLIDDSNSIVIDGADHIFNIFEDDKNYKDILINKSISFLQEN